MCMIEALHNFTIKCEVSHVNLEHVKHNFTCEISHVKNHMFQIHMVNFTHVKSCGIFVRVVVPFYIAFKVICGFGCTLACRRILHVYNESGKILGFIWS
jgi:hypothetical protein